MYCYFLYCDTVLSRKLILDISTDIRNPASTNNYANEKWQLQFPWNSSDRKLSFIHNNCFTNSKFFPCQCYSLGSGGFWSFYLEVSKLAWFFLKNEWDSRKLLYFWKFGYSEKAIKIWPISHLWFDASK